MNAQSLHKSLKQLGYVKPKRGLGLTLVVEARANAEKLGLPRKTGVHERALKRLGLPSNLLTLLEEGRLGQAVDRAWKTLDEQNALLDALEAEQPSIAKAAPWFEAREAWKAAGRPRAPWYEALRLTEGLR